MEWLSAHIYHRGDLDALLRSVVAPMVDRLAAERTSERYFFVRHWEGGDHLRLRIEADGRNHPRLQRLIERDCRHYFARCPSPEPAGREGYRAVAAERARQEGRTTYAEIPRAVDSLAFIAYEPEYDTYGSAVEATEDHFVESSRIALGFVRSGVSPSRRATAAYAMLLGAWFLAEPDPGPLATRVLRYAPDLDVWDERKSADGQERLLTTARQVRAVVTGQAIGHPGVALTRWIESLEALRAQVQRPEFDLLDSCARRLSNRLGLSTAQEQTIRVAAARAVYSLA